MNNLPKCITDRCRQNLEKYGEVYDRVGILKFEEPPEFMPDAIAKCQFCGGYTNGTIWVHVCFACNKEMQPGELVGLFVPHLCPDCERSAAEKQITNREVCGICRQPYIRCCC